ncbi:MAG: cysteine--tRNA ligase, partial [Deltaproteobacteria bacterium]|nr:cysteine--tRNA ligase [Deltaproteobacteria bacterium]
MAVAVYNTMTRRKEELFDPAERPLSLYVCGVTVYDLSHIGHARSAIAFDVICRYLRHRGYQVRYLRNFTDVDDKIIRRSQELAIEPARLAEQMIAEYHRDVDALGCLRPDIEPRVTETMSEIVTLIQRILDNGHAYMVDGDVYFSVRDFPRYGQLSGRSLEEMIDGARVEVDPRLRDPKDFALWKAAKPGEPRWDSPWGPGRPGWHIECSAMNLHHLGEATDIHGGGKDLIFPHHENEIAQSEAATGRTPWVLWWLHNGFVNVVKGGVEEKMSKSLGNFCTIREVVEQLPAEVLRFLMISTHYRKDLGYGTEPLNEARKRLSYIYETLERLDQLLGGSGCGAQAAWRAAPPDARALELFHEALDDDFNVPAALGSFSALLREANELCSGAAAVAGAPPAPEVRDRLAVIRRTVDEVGSVLGVFRQEPSCFLAWLKERATAGLPLAPQEIEALIERRQQARRAK